MPSVPQDAEEKGGGRGRKTEKILEGFGALDLLTTSALVKSVPDPEAVNAAFGGDV